jgi:hypothetical protein
MDLVRADAICAATAREQFGAFDRRQAIAAGHTRASISYRLNHGRWVRVYPTVYAFSGTPITWQTRYMAATLWDCGKCAISGPAAGFLRNLDRFHAEPLEISTTSGRRPYAVDFKIRRVDERLFGEIDHLNGIPTVSARRLLLELCGVKDRRVGGAMDQLWRKNQVSLESLGEFLELEWTRGRRGIRAFRDLVVARMPDRVPTQSELENMYRGFTREYRLPSGIAQWPVVLPTIGLVHFDFGYPPSFAVEIDSYAWHLDLKAFDRDRERDLEAKAIGITVVRVTYSMLRWRRPYLAQMLTKHFDQHRVGTGSR